MKHLLDLLAAIAVLVWGMHLVRNGGLRVFGSKLRQILAASMGRDAGRRHRHQHHGRGVLV